MQSQCLIQRALVITESPLSNNYLVYVDKNGSPLHPGDKVVYDGDESEEYGTIVSANDWIIHHAHRPNYTPPWEKGQPYELVIARWRGNRFHEEYWSYGWAHRITLVEPAHVVPNPEGFGYYGEPLE